jgi:hypothetical protein
VLVLAVLLRLEEPLSNPVLPAEDPFTHMVRVKAHLDAGAFLAQTPTGELYPPGMHAAVAAVWAFAGGDLYPLFRFAPVVLGGLGVLGTGLLLWRYVGLVAGFVGGLGAAMAPELVFRTTMMAPTAVDLALLPFLFYALLAVLVGRLAWAGPAAALAGFLVSTHPWVMGVLAAAGAVVALLALAAPWSTDRCPRLSRAGLALDVAIVGVGFGLVLSTCGGLCGPGFQEVVQLEGLQLVAPLVIVASLLPAAFLWLARDRLAWIPDAPEAASWPTRLGVAALVVLLAVPIVATGLTSGLPELVDPPAMLGWPLIVLAGLALAIAPLIAGPAGYLGVGLVFATLPLVLHDLFVRFVAHRAVVYLGLGAVILAGALAGHLTRWARQRLDEASGAREGRASWRLLVIPSILVAGSFGAGVVAGTPEPYADGWYHLYEPCELDAMRAIADRVEPHPSTLVVTGDWRPGIVLPAVADPEPRIWYHEQFFADAGEREVLADELVASPGTLYVVEDRHLRHQQGPDRVAFLREDHWQVIGSRCDDEVGAMHEVRLFVNTRTR